MEKYPILYIEEYIDSLTKDEKIHVPECKQNINVCISGGGMAAMYFAGCGSFLTYMTKNNNLKIHNIYGTSSGSIAGLILLLCIHSLKNEKYNNTKYEMNCSKFIYLVNNILREKYINDQHVIDNWKEVLEEIIPQDFYILCCDKLFITINVFDGFSIRKKVISKYKNNKHLINTICCSGTIPYITIKQNISKYYDYFTHNEYYAFDGIYPVIEHSTYPTLYINLMHINYSFTNRMSIVDKCYESLVFEGLYDIYHSYRKDLINLNGELIPKTQNNTCNIIYYHKPSKNKNKYKLYHKIIFYGIIIGTIYNSIKYNLFQKILNHLVFTRFKYIKSAKSLINKYKIYRKIIIYGLTIISVYYYNLIINKYKALNIGRLYYPII
jgi:hypothetical protein